MEERNTGKVTLAIAVKNCMTKYQDFKGNASRSEYWYWALFSVIATLVIGVFDRALFGSTGDNEGPLTVLFNIVTLMPSIAVALRRSNDADLSWVIAGPQIAAMSLGTLYSTVAYSSSLPPLPDSLFENPTVLLWMIGLFLIIVVSTLVLGIKRSSDPEI